MRLITHVMALFSVFAFFSHAQHHKRYRTKKYQSHHWMGLRKKKIHGRHVTPKKMMGAAIIPNSLDLRPGLTQIENQGNCGSCWAFSITATHRDGHALNGFDPGRLSQEWLVEHSPEGAGCSGGYFDAATDLIIPHGQPSWGNCPYGEGKTQCPAVEPLAAHILGWHMLGVEGGSPTGLDIESYMAENKKPVSITVAAGSGEWERYQNGIFDGCVYGTTDHMINIVGWNNEGAHFDTHGNLPPGQGYWIVRNSWGTEWGESGYMRTKMTDESGRRCNNVAEEAAYFDFPIEPLVAAGNRAPRGGRRIP